MFDREIAADRGMPVTTVLDAEGTIRYQSAAFERVCGYDHGSVVGDDVREYLHPEDRERVAALLRRSGDGADPFRYRFRHADGSWVRFEVADRVRPRADVCVLTSRDVTRQRPERKLER